MAGEGNPYHDKSGHFTSQAGAVWSTGEAWTKDIKKAAATPIDVQWDIAPEDHAIYNEEFDTGLNDKVAQTGYKRYQPGFGPTPIHSLAAYKGNAYRPINDYLRGRDPATLEMTNNVRQAPTEAQVRPAAIRLQKMISTAPPLKKDMMVYRGDTILMPDEGGAFRLKGFTSVSVSREGAARHLTEVGYEIHMPKGSRALGGFNKAEGEMLLPHGAKFKVVGSYTTQGHSPGHKVTIQKLEYLGV